ncbi:glycosyltransferase family 4 protein [Sphingobium abikonense]|uniref:glycosyltransferase family 4 protein n=1 Tax=Sphingobium abikonense TaxID=86193 RepID=UPI0035133463
MNWLKWLGSWLKPGASRPTQRRLFVDVSTIAQHDAGTGIQRVVRALWQRLIEADISDVDLVPVAATTRRGYAVAHFDPGTQAFSLPARSAPLVRAGAGDLFLGLDLAAHRLIRHRRQIARWRRAGASINLIVYDLLPLQRPDWFPDSTGRNFRGWIKLLMRDADRAICISGQVARDLNDMLQAAPAPVRERIEVHVMPLSGAIEHSSPTTGIDAKGIAALGRLQDQDMVLAVGTIEPRKGHDSLIAAMEHLWRTDPTAPHLVVVGRPGWRTEALQAHMRALVQREPRFLWLDNASDELLTALYMRASLVAVPSRGEGYGLPVAEALRQGRKVLARDLPVFRELERPGLYFFQNETPAALAARLVELLKAPDPHPYAGAGWDDSARALLRALKLVDEPPVSRSS